MNGMETMFHLTGRGMWTLPLWVYLCWIWIKPSPWHFMNSLPMRKEMPHYVKSVRPQAAGNIWQGITACGPHLEELQRGMVTGQPHGNEALEVSQAITMGKTDTPLVLAAKTGNAVGFYQEVQAPWRYIWLLALTHHQPLALLPFMWRLQGHLWPYSTWPYQSILSTQTPVS